jgi:WD40 repeat protein
MRFRFGGDQEKITAMTFDKAGRRLLTGSVSGVVKMWNFSNGGCLKTLMPSEASGGDEVDMPRVTLRASVPGFNALFRNALSESDTNQERKWHELRSRRFSHNTQHTPQPPGKVLLLTDAALSSGWRTASRTA